MLDIRFIRENPEQVQKAANQKGIPFAVEKLINVDRNRRSILTELEFYRSRRNLTSKEISKMAKLGQHEQMEREKVKVREMNQEITKLENKLLEVDKEFNELMHLVPNLVSSDTPVGGSDQDNVEIKRVGIPPEFDFKMSDHVTLGEKHDMLDIQRGVKVAGSRQYYLKNNGLFLHRAVQQLAIDLLAERGFTMMEVPLMVKEELLYDTGFFPVGKDQTYKVEKGDKWLVGTSEVPLIGYYSNEVLNVEEPIKLAGVSNCFRLEAGSAGRDVRGLYRVHQFAKVEQVIICKDDMELSEKLMQEITQNAEDLLKKLELPYRIVSVCTGDLSQKNYKQYDIETWMPSRNAYGETHSSSSLLDFQARRSKIRYRDEKGELRFCYTLNNTAVASPRILIPLIENHQRADGSIYIPHKLRKYMNDQEYVCSQTSHH